MKSTAIVAVPFFVSVVLAQDAPTIQKVVAEVLGTIDPARLDATVRTLAGFGTRHVLSRTDSDTEGTGAARKWLRAQYEALAAVSGGRLSVALQEETVPCARPNMPRQVPIVNVIATLRGTTEPDRVYVVGGHYDSRNSVGEDGKGAAPGAVDDASGTAVALEACRVLATRSFPATLVFVAYDGEEQGCIGSAAHAKALAASGVVVDGMIGCDIVGNTLGMDGARYDKHLRCFSYAPSGNDSHGRSLARAATFAARTHVPEFGVKLIQRGDRYGRGGDHRSFFDQGVPAVRFSEPREDFSRQHQNLVERDGKPYGDVPEFADPAYMANVTRVVVATLCELASAPPPPRVVSAQLRRDRYDTELVFEPPAGCERFEFVWRETTEPDWTHTIDMATAKPRATASRRLLATFPGVCLDDVVVGVRSVGADGSRSRTATPPEPDRFEQRPRAARAAEDKGGQDK
ncbi:MAG: M20/M25/M40 family metallo-hydrolase [Planctomycetes bacterium]|nr:M20/M25/M40 family metallo-hydrolase [Planctomycetota bacterium]